MWDWNYKDSHNLFTLQVALFCVVWAVGIRYFFNVESVKIHQKRQTTPWTKSSISPQSLFEGVRLRLENFPQIQWTIFVASHSGGPNLVFQWSAAWPRWQPLWWGEISFQNLGVSISALFLPGFTFFKQINRVCRFDRFLWNLAKMFLSYQCAKVCEAFLIFRICSLLHALNLRRSANIKFANFKIHFLSNQSK